MSEVPPLVPADSPPPRPEGDEERLDPIVVVYWLVSGMVSNCLLATLMFVVAWYTGSKWPESQSGTFLVAGILAAMLVIWALVAPGLAYARWRFAVGSELLRMRSGIVFHEEKAIPISRLQHVDLLRGPIERLFGLATLVVWTAGNEGASFRLQGLRAERAARLRDVILAARGDDVV